MKKFKFFLILLIMIILSMSVASPVSVEASQQYGKNYEVLVRFKNDTNRDIHIIMDHRQEYHVYNLTLVPGINYYWLFKGNYNYRADTCGHSDDGHTTIIERTRLTFGCHRKYVQ
jgi:hypothetical protein